MSLRLSVLYALLASAIASAAAPDRAKINNFRSQGERAYQAELAREKAGDCATPQTTYDINICYGDAVAQSEQNLKGYEDAIRGLIRLTESDTPAPMPGPAGPVPTARSRSRTSTALNSFGAITATSPPATPSTGSAAAPADRPSKCRPACG